MNIEHISRDTSTPEEGILTQLEYIMSCVSEGMIGDGKYEIELFIHVIENSAVFGMEQKREYIHILKNVTSYLNTEINQYRLANSLLWKLHGSIKTLAFDAIRQQRITRRY